ncbi:MULTISPECIES: LysR family transcriptional regulator [Rhizobium/Agrobacterium group]|uniref:LysR family transcriptional regulator n=1 Tax=Rhizobium/Agrobacterium group TaxID=227290 RepID=UPI0008DC28E8|nr:MULTISPECIES: LysR family transcriptional regulator [Rhizobium/Agrobacterium group]MCF1436499.1 LysR family transcriptional regulator [Allorhizobium ampelinum]MCF1464482.1 LysR family transcriptional regulator [Allorhizobium ampelinum]MCF1495850.1 LysR family transcriptional regulator [Allorhizobium ampelinum]MUO91216.1 LysR family transcriptional regulator [Agrobacterium vitis]MUZ54289.1 LysR family transcriptional regulator [Agrobacterium vitis]
MDNRAGEMEVFVAAAELLSFSAAGRRLNISPSAVSKLVTRLEDRLGTRLLVRSTRTTKLTPEGEIYLARAQRILAEIAETEQIVAGGGKTVPRGLLRVNASVGFGERYLLPVVPEFLALYPEVQLDISLTDGVIGLIEERTDIAIRSGPMSDSALKARKLLESRRVIVASPKYLNEYGVPETPQDLAHHNCFSFNFGRSLNEWPFCTPGSSDVYRLPISGNTIVNSGMIMRRLCLAGSGLGRVGQFHVQPDIDAGLLVPVLEDYNAEDIELIHAVFAGHEHLAARIRAFIDFIAERLV